MSDTDLLLAVQKESVARVEKQFGPTSAEARSTHNRRDAFRTSALLSDDVLAQA